MLALALALTSALAYGSADFLGGIAARRAGMFAVVLLSQAAGLIALMGIVVVWHAQPSARDFAIAGCAGVFGGLGVALLYQGLAIGRMGIVSPVTAVLAAATPLAWGVTRGERPTLAAMIGIAMALVAVVLVSLSPHDEAPRGVDRRFGLPAGLLEAIASGVVLGMFFVTLSFVGRGAGLAPLGAARISSILLVLAIAAVTRSSLVVPRSSLPTVVLSGVLDMTANALFLLASRSGLLSIVAVLSSLYPVATVALATLVLRERLSRPQWIGAGLALGGVVLIAL